MHAAGAGREQIVRQLLIAGAETWTRDHAGNSPLHFAAASGTAGIVRVLLTAGADVNVANAAGEEPIDLAAQNPDAAEIIQILVDAGASVD
jgi:ankyrin repeat protein